MSEYDAGDRAAGGDDPDGLDPWGDDPRVEHAPDGTATASFPVDVDDPLVQARAALLVGPDDEETEPVAASREDLLLAQLAVLDRRAARLAAAQARTLAALAAADPSEQRWSADAASLVLRLSPPAARTRLARATTLVTDLPATLAALETGRLPARHADAIAEASWRLPAATRAAFETRLLARAAAQTPRQLAQAIRRAQLALDPSTAEHRRRHALTDRGVFYTDLDDGLAELRLIQSADAITAIRARLDAAADLLPRPRTTADPATAGPADAGPADAGPADAAADPTEPPTRDQQRADLLVDAILTGLPEHALPTPRGRRPAVHIVVQAGTLLGTDQQPGWLAGHGPITAQHARAIAADPTGTWHRLLTDPDTGQLLDAGAHTYRPSPRLINYLHARDDTCAFPTCHQPAHRTEVDHCHPFTAGGPTIRANTALTCHRHNESKKPHHPFHYRLNPDHTTTWTHKPTGHTTTSHPPTRWTTPADDPDPEPPF